MSTEQVPADYDGPAARRLDAPLDSVRCRTALSVLADTGGPVREAALAWVLAFEASGRAPANVSEDDRREVRIALHHRVLPKLADAGLVERDLDEHLAEATDRGHRVAAELSAPGDERPAPRGDRSVAVLEALAGSDRPVSLARLAQTVADEHDAWDDRDAAAARLHHATLPKLDDDGLLSYDPDDRRVRPE